MKTLNLIITVILAMAIFSTNSFANNEMLDISEETGVKGWIIKTNVQEYCDGFGIEVKGMRNIEIKAKNVAKTNFGATIISYIVTADVEVEKYGKVKAAFYVYTGETSNASTYFVTGYLAGNPEQEVELRKFIRKNEKFVIDNAAIAQASMKLLVMD